MQKIIKILFLIFTVLSGNSYAQTFVTNDGLALTVQIGLTVTVSGGGFTNQTKGISLGTIDNAGTITLTGNWNNNSANTVFTTNTGTVEFKGTAAAQSIGGSNSTGFYNLTINNSFGTSPQIALGVNATAKNILTMTAGNINLAGFTMTLGTVAVTPGSLAYSTGWMYGGSFKRWFNALTIADGSDIGLFPMGSSADYRFFRVSAPVTAPTSGGTITVSHTNAATVTDVAFSDDVPVLKRHDMKWSVATADGLAGGTYNLRTDFSGICCIANVGHLRMVLSGSVVGAPGANGGTTANPIVRRTGLTAGNLTSNDFYIASVDASSPLPVTLLHFTAYPKKKEVELNWSTTAEINNDYFTIERTADGENFETVAIVDGAGNSINLNEYTAFDNKPLTGISYYRLKQTDFNGNTVYSNLVAVKFYSEIPFAVLPNPSDGTLLNIRLQGKENKEILVVVYDMTGRETFSKVVTTYRDGSFLIAMDPSHKLPVGIYLITATSENVTYRQKLVIE